MTQNKQAGSGQSVKKKKASRLGVSETHHHTATVAKKKARQGRKIVNYTAAENVP